MNNRDMLMQYKSYLEFAFHLDRLGFWSSETALWITAFHGLPNGQDAAQSFTLKKYLNI